MLAAYALDDERNPAAAKKVFDPEKRLTADEFPFLGQITAVYKPFSQVTTELQSAGVTSSLVVPALMKLVAGVQPTAKIVVEMPAAGTNYHGSSQEKLVTGLDPAVQKIARQAREDLAQRFVLRRMLPLAAATCLDPRLKVCTIDVAEWVGKKVVCQVR